MPKYIDANELIGAVDGNRFVTDSVKSYVRCTVRNIPAADVEPVRRGHWIPINRINPALAQFGIAQHKCSECGSEEMSARKRCPECGAKMGVEDDG